MRSNDKNIFKQDNFLGLQLFSLENQIVLITGSSRGLGWSMAKAVGEAGATVLLHGRDENLLKERKQYL
ncbi:MAG: SDR family NAD(P)-dependent oxidoreductase, partial [SAR324 cluster bacterium]|nr:SDR family NAD(P)-dependent oxidoreductase [SAR324 cluster bacterium]